MNNMDREVSIRVNLMLIALRQLVKKPVNNYHNLSLLMSEIDTAMTYIHDFSHEDMLNRDCKD